jgi:hypothetical protein
MKVFDPEAIEVKLVELNGEPIPDDAKLEYLTLVRKCKVAYIRITPAFRDFLMMVYQSAKVVGFEYDFDEAGLNFGIIVKDDDDDTANFDESDDDESDDNESDAITETSEE